MCSVLKVSLFIAIFGACGVAQAIPKITIGPMYEIIDSDKSTLSKRVRNHGDNTAYVRTEVREITYSAKGDRKETPLDTHDVARGNVDGLIFSPARMIIPAKGMQSGRLVMTGSRDRERYYRLRFIPVMPKDQYEFGQSREEFDSYSERINVGINVLTGYGALVIVRPKDIRFDTHIDSWNDTVLVRNAGNSVIQLKDVQTCQGKKCSEATSAIILPGSEQALEKSKNTSLQFILLEGSRKTPKSFG